MKWGVELHDHNSNSLTSFCPSHKGHRFLIALYILIHLIPAGIGHFVQSTKAVMINGGEENGMENKSTSGQNKAICVRLEARGGLRHRDVF